MAHHKQTTASHIASVVRIPGYEIKDLLGRGGMAMVYLAIQESIGREVALKILATDHTDDQFSERFLREARIISQLAHPNIITIFDAGIHKGCHYMAMEYIPGKNFSQARDNLDRKQKIEIITQISQALEFARKKGYVHRDIKPENILIHTDGRAILTDFGIAKSSNITRGLTETGKVLGTPYFMSPEQTKGLKVDHRSDIYSLGVVLFQALTGYVPYDGASLVAICMKHLADPIPKLPVGLEIFQPIINTCLSKDPNHRYQTAGELVIALKEIPQQYLKQLVNKPPATKPVHNQQARTMIDQPAARPRQATRASSASKKSYYSSPTRIADSYEYKCYLERRRKLLLMLLLVVSVASAYYRQDDIRHYWINTGLPSIDKYLPSKIKQYIPGWDTLVARNVKNKPQTSKKYNPVAAATPIVKTVKSPPVDPVTTLTKDLAYTPENAIKLTALYQQKLLANPDNNAARQGLADLNKWIYQRTDSAIATGKFVRAEKLINMVNNALPKLANSEKFAALNQKLSRAQIIEQHLQKARVYMAANALATPVSANAAEEFRAVLAINPQHPEALQGVMKISQTYLDKAHQQQSAQQYYAALDSVITGLKATPNNPSLLTLQKELKFSIQHKNHIATLLKQADKQRRADKLIQPKGESAYDLYQVVLTETPENVAAIAGLKQIENQLVHRARRAIKQNELNQANNILASAEKFFKQSHAIAQIRKKLNKILDTILPRIAQIRFSNKLLTSMAETSLVKIQPGQTLYIGFQYKNFNRQSTKLQAQLLTQTGDRQLATEMITVYGSSGVQYFEIQLPLTGVTSGNYVLQINMGDSRLIRANLFGLN